MIIYKLLCCCLLFYCVERFCHKQTDGFSIANIRSDLSYNRQWEVIQHPKNLEQLLEKKFYYLTKGAQCYVFVSADQTTILKFFKQEHFRLPFPLSYIPLPKPLLEKKLTKKKALDADFKSYKLAFDELKEETGLLFLHLNKSHELKTVLTIVDKLGIEHRLDPNDYEFLLQQKAVLVKDKINQWMQEDQIEEAKNALHSLLSLIFHRVEKGIVDLDPNLSKNFGFVGEHAIEIDIGRFSKNQNLQACLDPILHKSREDFQHWLNKHHPALAEYFHEEFQSHLQELHSETLGAKHPPSFIM